MGSSASICAYEWDGVRGRRRHQPSLSNRDPATNGSNLNLVAAGVGCDAADGSFQICAKTNDDIENAPWPFLNKDAETDFGPGQFFEGGINLSDMFGGEPPCFGAFLAETRTSAETDAQLKDFAARLPRHLRPAGHRHPGPAERPGNVSSINVGESVVDVATFGGTNGDVEGTAEFFVCGPAQSVPGLLEWWDQGRCHQDHQQRVRNF